MQEKIASETYGACASFLRFAEGFVDISVSYRNVNGNKIYFTVCMGWTTVCADTCIITRIYIHVIFLSGHTLGDLTAANGWSLVSPDTARFPPTIMVAAVGKILIFNILEYGVIHQSKK